MTEPTEQIVGQVKAALHELEIDLDHPIIVALSGGVDSQVLAHTLLTVTAETGHSLQAVHVDHRLRDESGRDAEAVSAICQQWELPCQVVAVDVAPWSEVLQQGAESAARAARYAALAGVAGEVGASIIATGHSLDDQIETVLLRLIAGSGLEGLGGIDRVSRRVIQCAPGAGPCREVTLLRPLIECARREIEAYARWHGLTPVEDHTNQLTSIRRNAVRLKVVPQMEAIEPAVRQVVSRTSALLREEAAFINETVDELVANVVAERAGVWMIERQQFRDAHRAQQRRVLYRVIDPLLSPSARIGQERIEALRDAAVSGRPGKKIELADDLLGYVDYDRLAIGRADSLEADLRKLSWVPLVEPGTNVSLAGAVDVGLDNGWRVHGEAAAESGLVLRTRQDGDRVRAEGSRRAKLQDWFVDHKVPRYVRDWLPLVAGEDEIKWIAGFDMTEYSDSRNGVHLYLERNLGTGNTRG